MNTSANTKSTTVINIPNLEGIITNIPGKFIDANINEPQHNITNYIVPSRYGIKNIIQKRKENKKKKAKFYHWSYAEPSAYNSFKKRHSKYNYNDSNYVFYLSNHI